MIRQPTFVGLGAPKAGTTWLARCLSEHPEVFVVDTKETNFFDWDTIEGRWPEYEKHYKGVISEKAVGEVSVRYFASPQAPERVHRHLPEARLFVVLRNPRSQLQSHYYHLLRQNFHQEEKVRPTPTIREAVERFPNLLLHPLQYGSCLEHWLKYFDHEQLLVLFHEDIVADPAAALSSLFRHIEVDDAFVPDSLSERSSETRLGVSPRSEGAFRFYQAIYVALQKFVVKPLTYVMGGLFVRRIRNKLRIRQLLEQTFFKVGYPKLTVEEEAWLDQLMMPEIELVERLLNRDCGHWHADLSR